MKVKDIVHECYYDTAIIIYDSNHCKELFKTNLDDGDPVPQEFMEMQIDGIAVYSDYLFIRIYIKD